MTPRELKNNILQLAIQGRLVEQRPEEGTAAEELRKKGKKAVIHDDTIDIPETWCWARMADLTEILYGFPFNSEKFNESRIGTPIIRIRDIIGGQSKTFSDEACDERYKIKRGDMLVGMDGNFQVAFWNSEDAWLNQRVCRITANEFLLDQQYLFYYLPIVLAEINGSVSFSTVKHLSAKILNTMVIPFPPLAEQKRIVEKIEELLPLVDCYEQAWNRLEDLNKRFPGDLQKSLLQLAIQGKLVEQRPEEGTGEELYQQIQREKQVLIKAGKLKKEKPLPEITVDEKPFDIPESWKWIRLGAITELVTSGSRDWAQYYAESGDIFLRMGNLSRNSFNLRLDKIQHVQLPENAEGQRTALQAGDLLFSITGEVGTLGLIPEGFGKAFINQHMMLNAMDGHYVDTGLRISDLRDALPLWYDNDGWMTQQAFLKLDPKEREDIFTYLRSLPLFYEVEIGNTVYRLIHAAPLELFEAHRWNYRSRTMFTVWYRWPLNEALKVDCTVIFGHTPTYYFAKAVDPMQIFHGEKRIGIDCGSGFPVNAPDYALPHGRLACLRLDDMKEFYSGEFLDPDDTEYTDEQLEAFWDQFADIPMNPETERMEEDFLCFPMRTHREEIWHWFDERHSKGVYYLLYERNLKQFSDNRTQVTSHERGSEDDGT